MSFAMALPVAFVVSYLIGSLPFGVILARQIAGVDIRKLGSGNIGATNVGRVLGKKYFAIVLALDCLKGALPTAGLPFLVSNSTSSADAERLHLAVLSGVAAILGHMFPCWLGFKGGKGVATALGVVIVLAPLASAVAFAAFLLCFASVRIMSLSSIVGACAFCGVEMWRLMPAPFSGPTWSLATFSTLVPLLIIARHRTNLVRLFRGEEPRFQFGKKESGVTDDRQPMTQSRDDPSPPLA